MIFVSCHVFTQKTSLVYSGGACVGNNIPRPQCFFDVSDTGLCHVNPGFAVYRSGRFACDIRALGDERFAASEISVSPSIHSAAIERRNRIAVDRRPSSAMFSDSAREDRLSLALDRA
ncbi:MAG: hypothetical protein ABWY49_13135, partial [Rhizobium sp.]